MHRKQLIFLKNWLEKPSRKPIILRGARQVGKSTLIRLFSEQLKQPLAEINLERHANLSSAFDKKNTTQLLHLFEALPNMPSFKEDTLLFRDEIQAVPQAIPILRYFYEDMNQLAVMAAGSLLEFTLSDHQFSMPVGRVEYMHMGPMTFTEFLHALDETKLLSVIDTFQIGDEIEPIIHQRLLELTRLYFFVGGMPEAVKTYAQTKQLKAVSEVHNAIIDTYREDFPKYIGSRYLSRIQHVFNIAARNVGKKVKYSQFSNQDKSTTIKNDIELLSMARVVSKVIHSHCSGLPLQADIQEKIYKLIFLDIGLMNAICGLGWQSISSMNEIALVNEGANAEQFIGQHLQDILSSTANRTLTYWLREGRSNNAEVDYVIALKGQIIPIEVKAGTSGSLKSLHQFVGEKGAPVAVRFDTDLPSQQTVTTEIQKAQKSMEVSYQLISLPLYLVERLADLDLSCS